MFKDNDLLYSVSDFYPDFVPCLILKLLKPKIKWIAGFFLFAPKCLWSGNPYRKSFLRGFLYWLSQQISYPLIRTFADVVFVTNELDATKFRKAVVVKGGVNLPRKQKYEKVCDVLFFGRFHPQKGIKELFEIWEEVLKIKPNYTMSLIGDGELFNVYYYKYPKNVWFYGFRYGEKLKEILPYCKIVVHPAIYDSGGMAMAEAMAYGLPGVSFDLPALRSYYPKGVVKVPCFDKKKFAEEIIRLLDDKEHYEKMSKEALELIESEWSWESRAEKIWKNMIAFF